MLKYITLIDVKIYHTESLTFWFKFVLVTRSESTLCVESHGVYFQTFCIASGCSSFAAWLVSRSHFSHIPPCGAAGGQGRVPGVLWGQKKSTILGSSLFKMCRTDDIIHHFHSSSYHNWSDHYHHRWCRHQGHGGAWHVQVGESEDNGRFGSHLQVGEERIMKVLKSS